MILSTRRRPILHAVLAFAVAALSVAPAGEAQGAPGLATVALTVNGHKITAEVASTLETRATGLMNRFSLKQDTGMLFVFEQPEPLAFWMKNTFIPLSIAFMDGEGRILNIEDMAPQTETSHWSRGPALYALEMRKGWFVEHGVKRGDRVDGIGKAAK